MHHRWSIILVAVAAGIAGCSRSAPPEEQIPTAKKADTQNPEDVSPATRPAVRKTRDAEMRQVIATYQDVARERGIRFAFHSDQKKDRFHLVEVMGGAAAWLDYDNDGRPDLYCANGTVLDGTSTEHRNRLYRSDGHHFADVTTLSGGGDTEYSFGLAVGDFDADGFADLYVTNYGANRLYRNCGDGTFVEVTDAGVNDSAWGTGCVWHDVNDDGLPDLFVANYLQIDASNHRPCEYRGGVRGYCGPQQFPAQPDEVFLNGGDGTFLKAPGELGLTAAAGYSLGIVAADLNDDCRAEIFVAADMTANQLFTRTGSAWGDTATAAGVAVSGNGEFEAGMGIAASDFDGDGRADLFLTHYYEAKNTLYRNLGDLIFSDDSFRSKMAAVSLDYLGFGASVVDVNRDGAPDLFVANGHVLGPNATKWRMPAQILLNNGQGRFADHSANAGPYFRRKTLGRGTAAADFDSDGDTDVFVVHLDGSASLLMDAGAAAEKWVGFDLRTKDRRSPAGGRVLVRSGEWQRALPLTAGGSYLSVADRRVLTALPTSASAVEATVFWPGGKIDRYTLTDLNRYVVLHEGTETAAPATR